MPLGKRLLTFVGLMVVVRADGWKEENLKIAGVSHMTITVSNMSASIDFYTKLLGGMLSEEMSMLEPTASREYVTMFTRGQGEDDDDGCSNDDDANGNCESLSSRWQVSWAFIIFDNMMVQLLHFTSLRETLPLDKDSNRGTPATPPLPHMNLMGAKLAFWVMDSVNMSEYANTLEEEASNQGLKKVKFIRPLLLADTADDREANDGVHSLRDEKLRGLSIGYASGPDGESLKFIQLKNTSKESFNKHYCRSRMVSSALLDKNDVDKCNTYKQGLLSRLYGINHISLMTMNINQMLEYYVNSIGGYLVDDIQPSNLQSPSLQKLLMKFRKAPSFTKPDLDVAKQRMDASDDRRAQFQVSPDKDSDSKAKDLNKRSAGKPPTASSIGLNLRYVLLGNVKLEIAYLSGLPSGMGDMMNALPSMLSSKHTSAAFLKPGHMELALTFQSTDSLTSFANNANPSMQNSNGSQVQKIEDGPLEGLQYVMSAGAGIDKVRLVHYEGLARRNLHKSLREYGAVSRMFIDTNPWNYYGYNETCMPYV